MITIVCVYKTGPKFDSEYVVKMYNRLNRIIQRDFKFVCLTDSKVLLDSKNINTQSLLYGFRDWWSKMELFRPQLFDTNNRVLYFDLDTLFPGLDIEDLLCTTYKSDFIMLRGFGSKMTGLEVPASGIMSWKPNCEESKKIYQKFMENPRENINRISKNSIKAGQKGDQGFIGEVLGWTNIPKFQHYLPRNYIIGKRNVVGNNVQNYSNIRIIAWSGNPTFRQMQMQSRHKKWINKIWC